jgi:molecular chaperone IbpA
MRTQFLTPLLRASVGFDHVDRLLDSLSRVDESAFTYPPYNIEKMGEDKYRITMAVAGFGQDDIEIVQQADVLVIKAQAQADEPETTYLHRGIARRAFERRFDLADTVKVVGAKLENGLLHVELVREIPEAKRPRTIPIQGAAKAVDQKIAA